MTFAESVKICLRKWRDRSGRAARSEFWWFWLFTLLISFVVGFVEGQFGLATWGSNPEHPFYGMSEGPLSFALMWLFLPPMVSVVVRRLHDRDASGWWALVPYSSYAALPFLGNFLREVEATTGIGRPSDALIGWFVGFAIWSVAALIFTIVMMLRGTQGGNRFGPDPLQPADLSETFR